MAKKKKKNKQRPTLLIDTHNLAFRVGWTFRDFEDKHGLPTGVIWGVTKEILRLAKIFDPEFIVCCFDDRSRFRTKLFPGYKDRKGKTNSKQRGIRDNVHEQLGRLPKILRWLPVRLIRQKGEEADDIIAHLCRAKFIKGTKIVISGDNDLLQLVGKKVKVFSTSRDELITLENFKDIVGCDVKHFVDVKAMAGDNSDCIPGIRGIGEKYGCKIVNAYGSLEEAVNALGSPEMPTALHRLITRVKDDWVIIHRNRKLMDLTKNKIKLKKGSIKVGHWDLEKFRRFCHRRGYKSILLDLGKYIPILNKIEEGSQG